MNTLALHIEYLLLRHDCVIVPGLGAFLAHREEARMDGGSELLLPPVRSLGFNGELSLNDGLLVGSVARRDAVSYEAARLRVDRCVESFIHQLHESGTVPVGRLGTLSVSPEANGYIFEPAEDNFVANLPCLGLEPVRLILATAPSVAEELVLPVRRSRFRAGLVGRVAASVMLLCLAVGILVSTGGISRDRHSDFAAIGSALTAPAVAEPSVPEIPVSRDILLNIAAPATEAEIAEPTVAPQSTGRYLLVVGSFPTSQGAERFIAGREGLSSIEMDGNHRIFAATASTITEAREKAAELSAAYPSVWVCRR